MHIFKKDLYFHIGKFISIKKQLLFYFNVLAIPNVSISDFRKILEKQILSTYLPITI